MIELRAYSCNTGERRKITGKGARTELEETCVILELSNMQDVVARGNLR